MKNVMFYLFTATLLVLSACSSDNDDPGVSGDEEIRLKASVQSIPFTKSLGPVNADFSVDLPIGIFAHNGAWLTGETANVINNDAATVAGSKDHGISFEKGPYYYPNNGSYLTFFAFAPRGKISTPAGNGLSPVVDIIINGKEDVMWATAQGRKVGSAAAEKPTLNFVHKLTQLQFTLKSGTNYSSKGYKVVSIKVKGQPNLISLNVADGTYKSSGKIDMEALSQDAKEKGIEITAAGVNASSPLITVPLTGITAYDITVIVRPEGSTETISYDTSVTVNAEMGKAHMITLTFSGTKMTTTTSVAPWITGAEGSASIS